MSHDLSVSCNLGQRSSRGCGPSYANLQTFGELDAATATGGGGGVNGGGTGRPQVKRLSWMLLSRVGINYLLPPSTYASWTVCQHHKREFLDNWQVDHTCCYPDHEEDFTDESKPTELISLVMAIKLLQATGKVIPISGKVCKPCVRQFEDKFGKKQGEKIVIVMKSSTAAAALTMAGNTLAMPSPFVKQEPGVSPAMPPQPLPPPPPPPPLPTPSGASTQPQRLTRLTTGALAAPNSGLKREASDSDDIAASGGVASGEPHQVRRRRKHNLTEADLEDDGSDDDRTWRPNRDEGASSDEEEEDDPPEKEGDEEEEEEEDGDEDDPSSNAISDGSSADLHYYCRICQITFYKHTSYKQHMRNSKKIHKELQKKDKEVDEEYECSDCCIAFKDKAAQLKHLATVHKSSPKGSFFCTICSVSLRSESAFRSHNSKLHLERDTRTYYCRECDDIFSCKVKHQTHIKTHRMWSGEDPGLQCMNCGKVFLSSQQIQYQRHLATHEFDLDANAACDCADCKNIDDDLASRPPSKKLKSSTGKKSLLREMRSKFTGERKGLDGAEAQAEASEDPLNCAQFECGICKEKFSTVDDLASHVNADHEITEEETGSGAEVLDEFPEDVEEEPEEDDGVAAAAIMQVDDEIQTHRGSQNDRLSALPTGAVKVEPVKAVGPDGMDRNWAATFGYGRTTSLKTSQSFDLISAMKNKFDKNDDEEDTIDIIKEEIDDGGGGGGGGPENNEDDEFTIYRVRGFKGRIKASLKKTPRTLSDSSRSARKRMDMLVRAAREQWNKKEGRKKKSPGSSAGGAGAARKGGQTRKRQRQKGSAAEPTSGEKASKAGAESANSSSAPDRGALLAQEIAAAEVVIEPFAARTVNGEEEEANSDADSDLDDFDDEEDELLIPLANSWVCEKRPNEERTKWLTFFWSPEGDQYASLTEVEEAQRAAKQKLDMAVFVRAWNKDPGRIPSKSK